MTTASTPASPGPSTPTTTGSLDHIKTNESITPPARPSSTPFPTQEQLDCQIRGITRTDDMDYTQRLDASLSPTSTITCSPSTFYDLPVEINECILDHLFGVRGSITARSTSLGKSKALRNWSTVLRHCRRREVSELALVSSKWRQLVQERLYRHLKIKGTRESVHQAVSWFTDHPHLCEYVRHIEIWFPVFQQQTIVVDQDFHNHSTLIDRSTLIRSLAQPAGDLETIVYYQSPSNNCTLEEIFHFIKLTFAKASILTLEGGERKKPPMVRHFIDHERTKSLPVLESIETLVCKGQWNLIRSNEDFQTIAGALPRLSEWHGSYAKPKSKSYLSMATILPCLPLNLTHLNICLEGDYRREAVSPSFVRKIQQKTHFCVDMAKSIPTLEHLTYTGRVCHSFFDFASKLSSVRTTRLKTVDLVVKNCCRPNFQWNDGSGITDLAFIQAFEALVTAGVKSLNTLAKVEFLRIRFIDLDSQVPPLNPYFQLEHNQCTGLWSETIVDHLARVRPHAAYLESDSDSEIILDKNGRLWSGPPSFKARPTSIKVSSYLQLSVSGITIT
ncbi:hypothetical protein F5884DRAFT_668023 [Xylogone sp. PMI_703]|nr:hypothetical protein F5884DRAFT_668023 [Xylogone sp. PMI_703]